MTVFYSLREQGARSVASAPYEGHTIEVVTGWDIATDSSPVHVYITDLAGARNKLADCRACAASRQEAIDVSFHAAWADLESR